ncbi:hypothetical protein BWD09_00535 [Neisseria dentiae]|uniref:Uncharacterized protein n=1 Tax=Neisseria dentiae TaxID=194197 RepID=A0A1X3DGD9_9NEIS|nr:hypothetical protein BWD09_00535 [Neisseria dentiae]
MVGIRICGIKNTHKMSNLAVLFARYLQIFPQKSASQACRWFNLIVACFEILGSNRRMTYGFSWVG